MITQAALNDDLIKVIKNVATVARIQRQQTELLEQLASTVIRLGDKVEALEGTLNSLTEWHRLYTEGTVTPSQAGQAAYDKNQAYISSLSRMDALAKDEY